jgi:predicted phage terminase large subunit-like protein
MTQKIRGIDIPIAYMSLFDPYRIKVVEGGRGSAKSESVGRYYLIKSGQRKGRFLCTREYQNSIADSVYKVLIDIIQDEENGIGDMFEYNKQTIINKVTGSDFIFKGLQDINGIKSIKGITDCWVEEAMGLKKETLEILIPTIREPNSELLFTLNRTEELDPVIERFCVEPDPDVLHLHTTYRDNKYFPSVLDKERLKDKARDINLYRHIWEGEPRRNKGNLFDLSWFMFVKQEHLPKEQDYNFRFITADTAYKDKEENDYTVFSYWGVLDKKLYLLDVIRKQLNAIDVESWAEPFIRPKISYNFRYVWIEDKGHGIYLNQSFRKKGIPVPTQEKISEILIRKNNKVERANNSIAWIDKVNNNVIINADIKSEVLRDIKQEMVFFPNGAHDDFCLSGDTRVATIFGDKQIKDIRKGNIVLTPIGLRRVEISQKTGDKAVISNIGLTGTPEHKVYNIDTFIDLSKAVSYKTDTLSYGGLIKWRYLKLLSLMDGHIGLWGRENITSPKVQQMRAGSVLKDFTLQFGSFIVGKKYPKAITFTIKTVMFLITTTLTWSVYRVSNTALYARELCQMLKKNILIRLDHLQNLGINHQRVESGIKKKQKTNGKIQRYILIPVLYVARHLLGIIKIVIRFVVIIVGTRTTAEKNNKNNNQLEKNNTILETTNKKVVNDIIPVYNIKVVEAKMYYANGILVSNCDTFIDAIKIGLATKDYSQELRQLLGVK